MIKYSRDLDEVTTDCLAEDSMDKEAGREVDVSNWKEDTLHNDTAVLVFVFVLIDVLGETYKVMMRMIISKREKEDGNRRQRSLRLVIDTTDKGRTLSLCKNIYLRECHLLRRERESESDN